MVVAYDAERRPFVYNEIWAIYCTSSVYNYDTAVTAATFIDILNIYVPAYETDVTTIHMLRTHTYTWVHMYVHIKRNMYTYIYN